MANHLAPRYTFVCTGNTCRSPMAEAIMISELKTRGISGIEVLSRGVSGHFGDYVTEESAQAIMKQYGFKSILNHEPRVLKLEEVLAPGLIITMAESHRDEIERVAKKRGITGMPEKLFTLGEYTGDLSLPISQSLDINDPIGAGQIQKIGRNGEVMRTKKGAIVTEFSQKERDRVYKECMLQIRDGVVKIITGKINPIEKIYERYNLRQEYLKEQRAKEAREMSRMGRRSFLGSLGLGHFESEDDNLGDDEGGIVVVRH